MFLAMRFIMLYVYLMQIHVDADRGDCFQPGPPEQLRIALRGPDAVTISWKTYGMLRNSMDTLEFINDIPLPMVEYSTNANFFNSNFSDIGTSTHYKQLIDVSWFHNCAVPVIPRTKYYYRIVAFAPCVDGSDVHSFTAQPTAGDPIPINITIVGDLGNNKDMNNNASTKTIRALAEIANITNFFLHVGDISYADDIGFSPDQSYEGAWNMFQRNMEVITTDNIYMTAPGNHEVTCNQLGDDLCNNTLGRDYRNFTAYLNRFLMPGDESKGYKNLWYSFDYGLVHFVIINTETDFDNAPSGPNTPLNGGNFAAHGIQRAWLEADLVAANRNRNKVPWIIVAGHRPFYGSWPNAFVPGFPPSDNCGPCATAFGELMFNNTVDFYFCGHVHWYERLYPVDRKGEPLVKNYTNPAGPIHVTTGAGGAAEGINNVNITANTSAIIITSYGYTRLEIKNSSSCRLTFYDSVNKREADSIDIFRTH